MEHVKKIRMIEPGDPPYQKAFLNFYTYNKYLRNPSTGLITLATIAKRLVDDTLVYSEAISEVVWEDVYDADIIFVSVNTFNAMRAFALSKQIRKKSGAVLVFGGMHASLHYPESVRYCDYVLTGDADESILEFIRAIDGGRLADFPGVAFLRDGQAVFTGERPQPEEIDTVPDRNLVYDYARMAQKYYTLWPQVHASRGCPHHCAYCTVIAHFGRKIRKRSPQSVVEDIRQAIAFHEKKFPIRFKSCVWITDDNFPHDRAWAVEVLNAIIDSGIRYNFSVQARYEVGFDDELLDLMKRAGFMELAMGVEFLDDESFREFGKKSTYREIVESIRNIRRHGIGVRGLFIVGAENHKKGIGKKIARFVKENKIHGTLVQSLFFTPGMQFFEDNKKNLIHQDWSRYNGTVVHFPKNIRAHELQWEIIDASRRIYSLPRFLSAPFRMPWMHMVSFVGEFFWQWQVRKRLKAELPYLERMEAEREGIAAWEECAGLKVN